MNATKTLRKFGFRLLIVVVIFLCIESTVDQASYQQEPTITNLFYFATAFVFFITTWELNDWLIKRHLQKNEYHALGWTEGLEILAETLAFALPFFALVYYVALFHFADLLGIATEDPWLAFRADFLRAALLAVTTIVFNLFYFAGQVKQRMAQRMVGLQQEVLAAQYSSLKSQISPHFLFNSLNTLTALIYEDRDLASDFVARLASCYRYILDNREKDLISLDKELLFLDSYIFMMEVRHRTSVRISTNVAVDSRAYLIPTLSLQMLVENALKHNYYSEERPLHIAIRAEGDTLTVENTLRKRSAEHDSTQLGIDNIKKRYSFHSQQRVRVSQTDTTFRVTLPLLTRDIALRIPLPV